MKDPAFLFYTSDFLTGVSDLTMEERGQYITLICLQHQKGHLSAKTIRLALGYDLVSANSDVLSKFTVDENGKYYNERLENEINKRIKVAETHRAVGKLGGRPKNQKDNQKDNQKGSLLGNQIENENDIYKGGVGEEQNTPEILFLGSLKNVKLTTAELSKLKNEYPDLADASIEFLSLHIADKGYKTKSRTHNLAIRRWVLDAVREKRARQPARPASKSTAPVIGYDK